MPPSWPTYYILDFTIHVNTFTQFEAKISKYSKCKCESREFHAQFGAPCDVGDAETLISTQVRCRNNIS